MRILVPFTAGPDSFQENVAHTLRKMGHEVMTAPRPFFRNRGRLQRMVSDLVAAAFPERWEEHERFVVAAARAFKPHMVLCLTQCLRPEVLAALRDIGVERRVAWWGDTPANMRGMGLLADGWDAIYIKDPLAARKLQAVGLNAHLLHEAMNPDWHCPQGGARNDSVAVAGNYYGYRQFLIGRLLDAGVSLDLYGFAPPRWGDPRIKSLHVGRYVTRAEKSAVFDAALACLNSTAMSEGDSLNCRAFEICGAGGLQLIEDKPTLRECFVPDEEVLVYRTVDDILSHLERARKDPAWAERIRRAGHQRAHSEHTYEQRLARILEGN